MKRPAKQKNDRAWSGKSRGGSLGYRFFIFLINNLGLRLSYAFLCLVVPYFIPFAPRATSSVWFYNRRILRYGRIKSCLMLVRHYYRFGQILIDRIAIAGRHRDKFNFEFNDYERFLQVLDRGCGAVLISAHVGNWEAGSGYFGSYGSRMNVVMYDAEYEKIKELLGKYSDSERFKVIPIDENDGLEGIVKMRNALAAGEYLCFQGDRYMDVKNTAVRRFMGREARFPTGPFLMGARLKVPVVFYYAMRGKGRKYTFHFNLVGDRDDVYRRGGEQVLLDCYVAATESVVLSHPQQWFNFYRFWE